MCMSFKETSQIGEWKGWNWKIEDENKLTLLIAHVAIGQAEVAESIIKNTGEKFGTPGGCLSSAINKLKIGTIKNYEEEEKGTPKRNYNRDGWLFQIIAWIASHHLYKSGEIFQPHIREADKGPDGLIVVSDSDDSAKIIICEEKATDEPRDRIRDLVWPEFEDYDSGNRDPEIISSAILLLKQKFGGDREKAINKVNDILNKDKRAFRVSVTITDKYDSVIGREKLFKGYGDHVSCDYNDRFAETLTLVNLGGAMDRIAQKTIKHIEKWKEEQNV